MLLLLVVLKTYYWNKLEVENFNQNKKNPLTFGDHEVDQISEIIMIRIFS
jgi:hypothetical protein